MTASSMVRPEQVQHLSESVKAASNGIKQELDTLDSAVSKLRNRWSGEAQEAYDTAHRNWNQKLDEINALLARIGTATSSIGHGYVTGDKQSAGRFTV